MTVEKDGTMKLPSELKRKVNTMAHAAGITHGELMRLQLLAAVESRLTAGASIAELREFLDDMGQHSETGDITPRQTHHAYTATD